jgi:hypothetical protein
MPASVRSGPLGGSTMVRHIRRAVVLLAGLAGVIVLSEQAAHATITLNHCEPLR